MSYRLLIADGHPLLRQGLRALLAINPDLLVIDEAADGRDAVGKTLALLPDLVLLDLALPRTGGIDAVMQIRRRLPAQKILALCEHDCELYVGEALRAGCGGCIKKDCAGEEMLLAVKTVLAGRRFIGQELANRMVDNMLYPENANGSDPFHTLSNRERAIFKLIAEGGTNRTAAAYLNLSAKTVEKHRANLMRKLRLNSAVELALLAVDLGMIRRPMATARNGGAMAESSSA